MRCGRRRDVTPLLGHALIQRRQSVRQGPEHLHSRQHWNTLGRDRLQGNVFKTGSSDLSVVAGDAPRVSLGCRGVEALEDQERPSN